MKYADRQTQSSPTPRSSSPSDPIIQLELNKTLCQTMKTKISLSWYVYINRKLIFYITFIEEVLLVLKH